MPAWLQNPHADYVLAAYAVALLALAALGFNSWSAARKARADFRKLPKN